MLRQRLGLELEALGQVADQAGLDVDLELVPGPDPPGVGTLEGRQSEVDGVAEEDAGEEDRHQAAHAGFLERSGGGLAARARSEVLAAHDDVTGLDP